MLIELHLSSLDKDRHNSGDPASSRLRLPNQKSQERWSQILPLRYTVKRHKPTWGFLMDMKNENGYVRQQTAQKTCAIIILANFQYLTVACVTWSNSVSSMLFSKDSSRKVILWLQCLLLELCKMQKNMYLVSVITDVSLIWNVKNCNCIWKVCKKDWLFCHCAALKNTLWIRYFLNCNLQKCRIMFWVFPSLILIFPWKIDRNLKSECFFVLLSSTVFLDLIRDCKWWMLYHCRIFSVEKSHLLWRRKIILKSKHLSLLSYSVWLYSLQYYLDDSYFKDCNKKWQYITGRPEENCYDRGAMMAE